MGTQTVEGKELSQKYGGDLFESVVCGEHLPFSPGSTWFLPVLWFCHLQFPAGMWKHGLKEGAQSIPEVLFKTVYLKKYQLLN